MAFLSLDQGSFIVQGVRSPRSLASFSLRLGCRILAPRRRLAMPRPSSHPNTSMFKLTLTSRFPRHKPPGMRHLSFTGGTKTWLTPSTIQSTHDGVRHQGPKAPALQSCSVQFRREKTHAVPGMCRSWECFDIYRKAVELRRYYEKLIAATDGQGARAPDLVLKNKRYPPMPRDTSASHAEIPTPIWADHPIYIPRSRPRSTSRPFSRAPNGCRVHSHPCNEAAKSLT